MKLNMKYDTIYPYNQQKMLLPEISEHWCSYREFACNFAVFTVFHRSKPSLVVPELRRKMATLGTLQETLYFPHRRPNPVRIHLKHTLCWQSQVHGLKHCGNKCTRGASVLLTFESEVRKLWRGSLAGQQRAGSRQIRWWNVRLACFCWAAATVAAGPADVSEHRPPNAGASCAVKVQPVTLTGARRNGPTHHFSPGEEEPFYPRHEVSLTPCLESFTPDGSRDLQNKSCQPIKTRRDRFGAQTRCDDFGGERASCFVVDWTL